MAHRGYARRYPENTLRALAAALDAGATRVEFDVQLTRDRVPVLLHDETLVRTCGVPGRVGDRRFEALAEVRAGEVARLGPAYADEPLPSLEAAVDFLDGAPAVTAFVELKRESITRFGSEPVLNAVLPILQPLRGRVVVISFDDAIVARVREREELPIGWCLASYDAASRVRAQTLRPEYLLTDHLGLPADGSRLWAGPWQWVLYEVTDPAVARGLVRRGADIIETMDPAAFAPR